MMLYCAPGRAWAGEGEDRHASSGQQVTGRGSRHLLKSSYVSHEYPHTQARIHSTENKKQRQLETENIKEQEKIFSYFLKKGPTFSFFTWPRNYMASHPIRMIICKACNIYKPVSPSVKCNDNITYNTEM